MNEQANAAWDRREALRHEWETTGVTLAVLERRLGDYQGAMSRHAARHKWIRTPEADAAHSRALSAINKPASMAAKAARSGKTKCQKARNAVEAWRDRWETDARVTQTQISIETGVPLATVRRQILESCWHRTTAVRGEAARIAAGHLDKVRYVNQRPKPTPIEMQSAVSSVFDLGTGRRVTTGRHHAEVYA